MYLQQIRMLPFFILWQKKILIDPVLAPKGSWLPVPVDELLKAGANRMLNWNLKE